VAPKTMAYLLVAAVDMALNAVNVSTA